MRQKLRETAYIPPLLESAIDTGDKDGSRRSHSTQQDEQGGQDRRYKYPCYDAPTASAWN